MFNQQIFSSGSFNSCWGWREEIDEQWWKESVDLPPVIPPPPPPTPPLKINATTIISWAFIYRVYLWNHFLTFINRYPEKKKGKMRHCYAFVYNKLMRIAFMKCEMSIFFSPPPSPFLFLLVVFAFYYFFPFFFPATDP